MDNGNGNGIDLEKIKEKCSKLIALSSSSNEHEAKLAMDKLAEILAKYNLDSDSIHTKESKPSAEAIEILSPFDKKISWEGLLVNGVSRAFDCFAVGHSNTSNGVKYSVFGQKSDLELFHHFYEYILKVVGAMSWNYSNKVKDRNDFALGMVFSIVRRLKEMYSKKEEIVRSTSKDLMVVKRSLAETAAKDFFGSITRGKSVKYSSKDAMHAIMGKEEGERVPLNRAISGGEQRRMVSR